MIEIKNKTLCTGCGGCVQKCPRSCISMNEDEKGFKYPKVEKDKCIRCNLCDKVCPFNGTLIPKYNPTVYAARTLNDDILKHSSSGGIFSELCKIVLSRGGVIFGASFNENFEVEHTYIEKFEDIYKLQGSKYVQSDINLSFLEIQKFLKDNRLVLFSGTPCQVSGLLNFLGKEYDNLVCIDFICHGVPSPLVWRSYLNYLEEKTKSNVSHINFRDKSNGWRMFNIFFKFDSEETEGSESQQNEKRNLIFKESVTKNIYLKGFINNLFLRPSCYNCHFKSFKSKSDITLGDCWGIEHVYPELNDNRGYSLVFLNTDIGKHLFDSLECFKIPYVYDIALNNNPSIKDSVKKTKFVTKFWKSFHKRGIESILEILEKLKPSIGRRIINKVFQLTKF